MGTRNLTIVKSKGKVKVAQYGQWDGYPTGQGKTIAGFLKTADLKKFKKLVDVLTEYKNKEIEDAYVEAGAERGAEFCSSEIADKVKAKYPELSRDQGADILFLIAEGTVKKVSLAESFEKDKTFCEYCYKIDLDNETVEMNGKKYPFKKWISEGFMEKLEKSEDEED